jgi:class 3 adenylate cyclase/pimeloyl-ACP methyl ester carboxylesterase
MGMEIYDSDVQYAWNGDVALAYRVFGSGPIDLLYLPGFTSNVQLDYEGPGQGRFLRRLTRLTRVISMDRRGWGCSDRLNAGSFPPLETLAEDVQVVMEAVGATKVAVLATGDNGALGLLMAASHPDRVTGLILYEATPSFVRRDDMPWLPTPDESEAEREEWRAWGTREVARKWFAEACPSAIDDAREFEWYVRWVRLSNTRANALAELDRYADTDLRHILPTIHVPTLVLHRTEVGKWGNGIETARYLTSHIDGATMVELPSPDLCHWTGDREAFVQEVEAFLTGVRRSPTHDRVLATVLFTDIVGSTALAVDKGDTAWKALLGRHDEISESMVDRHGGRFVKHTGDGIMATFDGPARAVRCARSISEAVSALELEIRAGLHTGEVEIRGEGVEGVGVHIGARVCAEADGSEVLVSQTVKDLVIGSGLEFEDAGERELKGMPTPWRLYRLVDSA